MISERSDSTADQLAMLRCTRGRSALQAPVMRVIIRAAGFSATDPQATRGDKWLARAAGALNAASGGTSMMKARQAASLAATLALTAVLGSGAFAQSADDLKN